MKWSYRFCKSIVMMVTFALCSNLSMADGFDPPAPLAPTPIPSKIFLQGGHSEYIRELLFSSGGKYAVTSGTDDKVCVWDAANGELLRKFDGDGASDQRIAISPYENLLAIVSGIDVDRKASLYNIESGRLLYAFRGGDITTFSPNGKLLATNGMGDSHAGAFHGITRIWDVSTGKLIRSWKLPMPSEQIQFLSNDELVSSESFSPFSNSTNVTLRFWDVFSGKMVKVWKIKKGGDFVDLAASPDGKTIIVSYYDRGSNEQLCSMRDVATGKIEHTFNNSTPLEFSNSGGLLAIKNGEVDEILDTRTWDTIRKLTKEQQFMAFTPEGNAFATTQKGHLSIWKVDATKPTVSWQTQMPRLENMAFTENGTLLCIGSGVSAQNIIWRWDISSGKQLPSLQLR